ncbi:hypothetical protein CS8_010270 [Cupriavidus sp. 8B]
MEALERQLQELRTQFLTELERTREQVAVAQEWASATERRALREIDQERMLRQKGAQARAQDAAVAGAEARARLEAERDTLSRQWVATEQALMQGQGAQERLLAELAEALRRAERAQAEATATRVTTRRRAPVTRTKFRACCWNTQLTVSR